MDRYQREIEKVGTITVLSKNKNWITINAKTKDRSHPLETEKVKQGETSKIIPEWMQPRYFKNISKDILVSRAYRDPDGKNKVILVDRDNEKNKSVFSIMDYRHNVCFDPEYKQYQNNVMMKPKKFFDWDDGFPFDPKHKNDYHNLHRSCN